MKYKLLILFFIPFILFSQVVRKSAKDSVSIKPIAVPYVQFVGVKDSAYTMILSATMKKYFDTLGSWITNTASRFAFVNNKLLDTLAYIRTKNLIDSVMLKNTLWEDTLLQFGLKYKWKNNTVQRVFPFYKLPLQRIEDTVVIKYPLMTEFGGIGQSNYNYAGRVLYSKNDTSLRLTDSVGWKQGRLLGLYIDGADTLLKWYDPSSSIVSAGSGNIVKSPNYDSNYVTMWYHNYGDSAWSITSWIHKDSIVIKSLLYENLNLKKDKNDTTLNTGYARNWQIDYYNNYVTGVNVDTNHDYYTLTLQRKGLTNLTTTWRDTLHAERGRYRNNNYLVKWQGDSALTNAFPADSVVLKAKDIYVDSVYLNNDTLYLRQKNLNTLSLFHRNVDTTNLYNLLLAKRDRAGFETRTGATLSLNNANRLFTISGSYTYYISDYKYIKTFDTITIGSAVGMYFIYYSPSNVLTCATSEWDIAAKAAPIATVYWDGSKGAIADERHSANRDRTLHEWAHHTIGTRYFYGLSGSFTNTSTIISAGSVFDEDLEHAIAIKTNDLRMWYRNASSQMVNDTNESIIGKVVSGALKYDNNGTLSSVTNNRYINSYIYASNDINYPIYVVIGQNQYTTSALAQNEALPTIPNISTLEWKLLYRVTLQQSGSSYTVGTVVDYRTVTSLPQAIVSTLPASSVTYVTNGNITATNVQYGMTQLDSMITAKTPGYWTKVGNIIHYTPGQVLVGTTDTVQYASLTNGGMIATKFITSNGYSGRSYGNEVFGYQAGLNLMNNATITGNTFLGEAAGRNLGGLGTTSEGNTGIGYQAGANLLSGWANTFIGAQSGLIAGTHSGSFPSYNNTAVGYQALSQATNYNTAIGAYAMQYMYNGSGNTAVGYYALGGNATNLQNGFGVKNIAVGNSIIGNTSAVNINSGSYNSVLGYASLQQDTSGYGNIAIGANSGNGVVTGNENVFIGYNTGTGTSNIANSVALGSGITINESNKIQLGNSSVTKVNTENSFAVSDSSGITISYNGFRVRGGIIVDTNSRTAAAGINGTGTINYLPKWTSSNTLGNSISFEDNDTIKVRGGVMVDTTIGLKMMGLSILKTKDTKYNNLFLGFRTGTNIISGTDNIGVGHNNLFNTVYGFKNIFIGNYINYHDPNFYSQYTYSGNIGIGDSVFYRSSTFFNNIAIGNSSQRSRNGELNSSDNNISLGHYSLFDNSISNSNIAIGNNSLYHLTSGLNNIGIGNNTLKNTSYAVYNIAIGNNVLQNSARSTANIGIGNAVLQNTTGNDNIAVGVYSLANTTSGYSNTAVGTESGSTLTTGQGNVFLGYRTGVSSGYENTDNSIAIGSNTIVNGSNSIAIGSAITLTGSNLIQLGNNSSLYVNTKTAYAVDNSVGQTFGNIKGGIVIDTFPNAISGNGTNGYIPKWTAYNVLNKSIIKESNDTIDINGGLELDPNAGLKMNSVTILKTKNPYYNNLLFGKNAGLLLSDGYDNIVFGSGLVNTASGYKNVIIGNNAISYDLTSTYSMYNNIGIGDSVFYRMNTGYNNIAIGNSSQRTRNGMLNSGTDNISIGNFSLFDNDQTVKNIAIGTQSLEHLTLNGRNIAIGWNSMNKSRYGATNIAIGLSALVNGEGAHNIGIGTEALKNVTGNYNIGLGSSVFGNLSSGGNNIGIGQQTLAQITTQNYNIGIGYYSANNVTGDANVAIGYQALQNPDGLVNSTKNIAIGYNALRKSSNSDECVAIGYIALGSNNYNSRNTAIGYTSQTQTYSGPQFNNRYSENTSVGYYSLWQAQGERNVNIGAWAINGGTHSTGLGAYTTLGSTVGSTVIGYKAYTDKYNVLKLGRDGAVASDTGAVQVLIGTDTNTLGYNARLIVSGKGYFGDSINSKKGYIAGDSAGLSIDFNGVRFKGGIAVKTTVAGNGTVLNGTAVANAIRFSDSTTPANMNNSSALTFNNNGTGTYWISLLDGIFASGSGWSGFRTSGHTFAFSQDAYGTYVAADAAKSVEFAIGSDTSKSLIFNPNGNLYNKQKIITREGYGVRISSDSILYGITVNYSIMTAISSTAFAKVTLVYKRGILCGINYDDNSGNGYTLENSSVPPGGAGGGGAAPWYRTPAEEVNDPNSGQANITLTNSINTYKDDPDYAEYLEFIKYKEMKKAVAINK